LKQVYTVRELPEELRPRERLLRGGPQALSDAELVAILLGSGSPGQNALGLAEELLVRYDSLAGLSRSHPIEVAGHRGVGEAKAARLSSTWELGRRLASSAGSVRAVVRSAADVASLLLPEMRFLPEERFREIVLNAKNEVLKVIEVSVGTLNASLVHPREVYREAIRYSGASIIVAHNHPSGNVTPSREDERLTKRLASAGELIGIPLLDHVIIGDGKFLSLKEEGLI